MTPDDLKARTKKFAVDVIRFAKAIPRDHINDEIASQLTDAATSTAAHYRASCGARSRADFINKLAGGIEEVDESALWLEVRAHSNLRAFPRNGNCQSPINNESIIKDQQIYNRQIDSLIGQPRLVRL
jgi:four helix bundle protein